ncbi:epoxide hydrolase family protein [Xanthomonas phaseoli]|uniref:Epoxide hydrolase n=1 Tax=Xanthomonas phaseoli pv. dieffenbachiae TaxID=92828 RepID=A0A1V9GWY0_9XANT|nr:epoxide hydrolase family protein [Xanthomonas phaseoli]MBO9788673.1 alpha/beta fold hydrolase [Xanthomonas phaseoli pv. dieffenbachiae]MBO9831074.1 alpha/beta fold hydrolase [Xanthomonas phaseoli pv. dieffenbachiae]MBO9837409.1 alpha/beta fold hydrolase [Xanthomonas phaseoli pv. dieffenbachiae]MBO9839351.1 alpha/beta fold hydrolase [Xanthomonas phaseoli pv. dieffenbachiae]MBO9854296.1 alpha/beta fold hydrolase [Xanthomonas phaseoli pv. dieffenbachiae]
MTDGIAPFQINIAQAELDDLDQRLGQTRWPGPETVSDQSQGPQSARIRRLVERWRTGYDWRATERSLNGWNSSRTAIDGLDIHFLNVRSPEPGALPLLLTHGWPGSILEFRDVIGPLSHPVAHGGKASDAFHLVIPSLPGFGFSGKPTARGWGVGRTAAAWVELMRRLGYGQRWTAQGGDWGSAITTALGFMQPPGLLGIHLNMVMFDPSADEIANATPAEQRMLDDAKRYQNEFAGYMRLQSTRPQSVAFSLADSPAGIAAWLYALFQDVSQSDGEPENVIALDHLIDDIMLYWLPNAGPSSVRFYWEAAHEAGTAMPTHPMPTPTGISMFPGEQVRISRRWAERRFADLRFFAQAQRGGHFAAMENPPALVDHLRETFRSLR